MARRRSIKNTTIPDAIKDRELLDSLLNEANGYLREIDRQKHLLKGVKETMTDKHGKLNLDTKYVNKLIKVNYNKLKIVGQVRELQSTLDDYDVLKPKKESETNDE